MTSHASAIRRRAIAAIVVAASAVLPGCADDRSADAPAAPAGKVAAAPRADQQLITAAATGDLPTVRQLLAAGASVRAVDDQQRTALVRAAYGAHLEVAEVLMAAGADPNTADATRQSAYLIATSEIGDAAGLQLLRATLARGADVRSLDSYNGTGLIRAADRGFVTVVQELLTTPIDIDHVNRLGWTALLESIILGRGDAAHLEVVRVLVGAGADVNRADGSGVTPLGHARARGYTDTVAVLEAAGAR